MNRPIFSRLCCPILVSFMLALASGCASSRLSALPDGGCRLELVTIARAATARVQCGDLLVEADHEPISPGFASLLSGLAGYLAGLLGLP